ncbi:TolC family protein, partial [Acinetobacter baumannii]
NAEIAAARQSLLVAEEEIAKAKAGHTPRLDLNVSYGRDIANSIQTYTQDNLVKSVGVQLVVPLYSGGYTSSAYRQAVANRD